MVTNSMIFTALGIVAVIAVAYGTRSPDLDDYRSAPKLFHRKIRQAAPANDSSFVLDLPYPSHFLFSLQLLNVSLPFLMNVSVPEDPPVPEFNFTDLFKDKPDLLKPTELPLSSSTASEIAVPKPEDKPKVNRKRNNNERPGRPNRNRRPVRSPPTSSKTSHYFPQVPKFTVKEDNANATNVENKSFGRREYPLKSISYEEYKRRASAAKATESPTISNISTKAPLARQLKRKTVHAFPVDLNLDSEAPAGVASFGSDKPKSEKQHFLGYKSQSFQSGSTATPNLGNHNFPNVSGSTFASRSGFFSNGFNPRAGDDRTEFPSRKKFGDQFTTGTSQQFERFTPFTQSGSRGLPDRQDQRRQFFEVPNLRQQKPFRPSVQLDDDEDHKEVPRPQIARPLAVETKFPGGYSRFSNFNRPGPFQFREGGGPQNQKPFESGPQKVGPPHTRFPSRPEKFGIQDHPFTTEPSFLGPSFSESDFAVPGPSQKERFQIPVRDSSENNGRFQVEPPNSRETFHQNEPKKFLSREPPIQKEVPDRLKEVRVPTFTPQPLQDQRDTRFRIPVQTKLTDDEDVSGSEEESYRKTSSFLAQTQDLQKLSAPEQSFSKDPEDQRPDGRPPFRLNPDDLKTTTKPAPKGETGNLLLLPFPNVLPSSFPLPNLTFPSFEIPGSESKKPNLPPPLPIEELIKKFTGSDPITVPPAIESRQEVTASPFSDENFHQLSPSTTTVDRPTTSFPFTTPSPSADQPVTQKTTTPSIADLGLPSLEDLEASLGKLLASSSTPKPSEHGLEAAASSKLSLQDHSSETESIADTSVQRSAKSESTESSVESSTENGERSSFANLDKVLTSFPEVPNLKQQSSPLNEITSEDSQSQKPFLQQPADSTQIGSPPITSALSLTTPSTTTTTQATTTVSPLPATTATTVGNATTVASVQRVLDVSTYEALASIQGNNFGVAPQQGGQQFSLNQNLGLQQFGLQQGGLNSLAFSSNGPNPFIVGGISPGQQQFNFGDSDSPGINPNGPPVGGYNAITQGLSLLSSFGGGGGVQQQFNFNNPGQQQQTFDTSSFVNPGSTGGFDLSSAGQASSPGVSLALPQQFSQSLLGQGNQQFSQQNFQLSSPNQLSLLLQQQPQQSFSTAGNTQSSLPLQLLQLQGSRSISLPSSTSTGINPAQFGTLFTGVQQGNTANTQTSLQGLGSSSTSLSSLANSGQSLGSTSLTGTFSSSSLSASVTGKKASDTQSSGSENVEVQAEPPSVSVSAKTTDLETAASNTFLVPIGSLDGKALLKSAKKSHTYSGLRSGYYG